MHGLGYKQNYRTDMNSKRPPASIYYLGSATTVHDGIPLLLFTLSTKENGLRLHTQITFPESQRSSETLAFSLSQVLHDHDRGPPNVLSQMTCLGPSVHMRTLECQSVLPISWYNNAAPLLSSNALGPQAPAHLWWSYHHFQNNSPGLQQWTVLGGGSAVWTRHISY